MDEKPRATRENGGYLATPATGCLCEFDEVLTDAETGRTVARYDRETVPLSVALPALIAQHADVDPVALPPMYDCIDVDALEQLVHERADHDVTIRFRYAGYTVEADRERLAVQQVE